MLDLDKYDFEEQRDCFAFNSLFTRIESIKASEKVSRLFSSRTKIIIYYSKYLQIHAECNRVKQMSLFNTTLAKSMKIEAFEQTQSQAYTQVCLSIFC